MEMLVGIGALMSWAQILVGTAGRVPTNFFSGGDMIYCVPTQFVLNRGQKSHLWLSVIVFWARTPDQLYTKVYLDYLFPDFFPADAHVCPQTKFLSHEI